MKGCWLILVMVPGVSLAEPDLQLAEKQFEHMEYEAALRTANRVLESPESQPEDLMTAYLLIGFSNADLGRHDAALDAFGRLLSIDPTFDLPPSFSPKEAGDFYQALAWSKSRKPIALAHQPPALKAGQEAAGRQLVVEVQANPFDMMASVRFQGKLSDGRTFHLDQPIKGTGPVSFWLPRDVPSGELRWTFEARNRHGGILYRLGGEKAPFSFAQELSEPPPEPPPSHPESHRVAGGPPPPRSPYNIWGHITFWTGLGITGMGVVALSEALDAGGKYNDSHGKDTASADRSRAWAGVMYAGLSTGLALVVTGVVLWIITPADGPKIVPASVGVAPVDRGAVVTFGARW